MCSTAHSKARDPNDAVWSSDVDSNGHGGQWVGGGALDPVVDVAAWDDTYSAETTAGGIVVNGYNWNTKANLDGNGLYRLTYVLEGSAENEGKCSYSLNTFFGPNTKLVNPGNVNPGTVVSADYEHFHHGEGGLPMWTLIFKLRGKVAVEEAKAAVAVTGSLCNSLSNS